MIRNGKDIASGSVVSTQICIIGSGPAGITAAWYLQKAGLNVTLIEGSRDFRSAGDYRASWPDKVFLYNGTSDGLFATNEPEFLLQPYYGPGNSAWERERIFGGTSSHWGGQSRPLDPITFEERPGFPGWPISRADLDPYYAKAAAFCALHSDDFSAEYWAEVLGAEVPHLSGFDTEMYQFMGSSYLNFATRTFDGITIGESAVDVILNASLLDIDHTQGSVQTLRVASMDDQSPPQKATEFTIKADVFVLACGAVANARQLLLSNAGNEHDQVGRYFMCHPLSASGVVSITGNYLTDGETRLMNGETLAGARQGDGWKDKNGVTVTGRFSPNADQQRAWGIGSCWFWAGGGQYYFEMAPNPDSRVTLADTLDPVFGQQQTRITWELGPRDEATYTKSTELFKTAVNALNGDVYFPSWGSVKDQLIVNGHHIGTTRMSADPTQGVVDANLKVHALDNLYVAGSSVFASTGISNPTFTIITLSIRLAEHLCGVLGK
ncbi:MAG: GMC family oxidoreductase [Sphingomonas sp.]|jgi:choline dehydrogenase-like flavoprotein|uniref:FAD-dependent oxidoreductase n=1 Tax=Sphingomonas sp. TaxID=28214 RepID=UPI0035696B53